jgi:hypothetical protein
MEMVIEAQYINAYALSVAGEDIPQLLSSSRKA